MSDEGVRWCLVLPVKRLAVAKTRLGAPYAGRRRELALAFALDTAAAALAAPGVCCLVAVTDEARAGRLLTDVGAHVVPDEPDAGLNPALLHGAEVAARRCPSCGTGALSADLPALDPAELGRALERGVGHDASFARDAEGSGTTLVLARPGVALRPVFGPRSASRHTQEGHVEILGGDIASLRQDVDTAADLDAALALGVGPRTADVLARPSTPDSAHGTR